MRRQDSFAESTLEIGSSFFFLASDEKRKNFQKSRFDEEVAEFVQKQ
jgi:hypothetical protein